LIALNKEDKAKGRYTRIDSIQWSENPVQGWVKGREFPVIFHRQVFTNKDDQGITPFKLVLTADF
jgi:hypothetical protein